MNGIRPGKTTKTRDKDYESTNISYKLNQSQLLSEIDSDRSQPKSGNDKNPSKQLNGQKNVLFSGREALAPKKGGAEVMESLTLRDFVAALEGFARCGRTSLGARRGALSTCGE